MKFKANLFVITSLLLAPSLRAADQTWIDSNPNNNWNTATDLNWDAGVAWTQGNNAIYGGTGETVTLATGITVGNITFNSGDYEITGNTLTLSSSTINTGANDAKISSTLAGSTGLTKTGSGTLTISTLPTISAGDIAINEGTLTYSFNGGTLARNLTGSGTLNLMPSDSSNFREFAFTGNNSGFSGALRFDAGAFRNYTVQNTLPGAGSSIEVLAGGEILINNGLTYAGNITITGTGIGGGGNPPGNLRAALHLYNATVSGTITLSDNARIGAGNAGPASTLSGEIKTEGYTVEFNNNNPNNSSGAIHVTGAITGTGSVTVSNSAANGFNLTLSGANTYSGDTTVSSGTMLLGANDRIPNGTGMGDLAVNGTLNLNGKSDTVNGLSGTGTITGTGTLTVGDTDASSTFGGVVRGSAALAKTGAGTLTLTAAANSDTLGGIAVDGGTLEMNGTLANGGALSVNTGGTLTGTGTINRPAVVNPGGVLAPAGGDLGTITFGGALQANAGGNIRMQIDKNGVNLTSDLIIAGSMTFGGELEVVATGDTLAFGDQFMLFDATSYASSFSTATLPSLPAGLSWDLSALNVDGTITVSNAVSAPLFAPPAGGYVGQQSATISSESGSTIHYTMDGSDPKTSFTTISVASPATGIIIPTDTPSHTPQGLCFEARILVQPDHHLGLFNDHHARMECGQ